MSYQKALVEKIKIHQSSGVSPFLENISYCTCMVGSGYMYRNGGYLILYMHGRFSVNIFAHHHIGVHVCVHVQIYV